MSLEKMPASGLAYGLIICHCCAPQSDSRGVWLTEWSDGAIKPTRGKTNLRHPKTDGRKEAKLTLGLQTLSRINGAELSLYKHHFYDTETKRRIKTGRRPKAKGHATRGDHGAAGTRGRGTSPMPLPFAGYVAGRLDHRQDQEGAALMLRKTGSIQPL